MDAHSTVTAEEGDRYPLGPPSLWSYRLSVRTLGFHPGKRGSIPRSSSKICARSIMDNTLGYELSNGGSIPSGRTKYSSIVKWYNNRLITGHYKFDSCWRNQNCWRIV